MENKYLAGTTLALSAAIVSVNASAEILCLMHGRSANPASMSRLSAGAGLIIGGDFDSYGVRLNYVLSDRMSIYGDLALTDAGGFNGDGFGFGAGSR